MPISALSKPTIGLTGGIASGKSRVAAVLRTLGVVVIDADALARDVVLKGSTGLAEIVARFGAGVLDANGQLDREKLSRIVFSDPTARRDLNAITHPRIGQLSLERIAAAQATATPYVVYEAPLLVETGAHKSMSALVVVAADEKLQLERAVVRDQAAIDAVRARIAAQLPLQAKIDVADYVIDNNADLTTLETRTREVHRAIIERFELTES